MKLNKNVFVAVAAAAALASQSAFAALPASVGTSITAMQTDGQAIFDLVFPVVAAMTGLVIVIKLMKRFSNKI